MCNRLGTFQPKGKTPRDRKLPPKGSCKIGLTCPAYIVLKKDDSGKLRMTYNKTHYGHKLEPQYLRLPKDEVEKIKAKLANDVTVERILDDAHESLEDVSPTKQKRIGLLVKKDLSNIMNRHMSSKKGHYDKNDADSITIWIELQEKRMREQTGDVIILGYKKQGELDQRFLGLEEKDFFLCFMTTHQKKMISELLCKKNSVIMKEGLMELTNTIFK